jgi:hypothetical protein
MWGEWSASHFPGHFATGTHWTEGWQFQYYLTQHLWGEWSASLFPGLFATGTHWTGGWQFQYYLTRHYMRWVVSFTLPWPFCYWYSLDRRLTVPILLNSALCEVSGQLHTSLAFLLLVLTGQEAGPFWNIMKLNCLTNVDIYNWWGNSASTDKCHHKDLQIFFPYSEKPFKFKNSSFLDGQAGHDSVCLVLKAIIFSMIL